MIARLKEIISLAVDGLFGDRYGFFDLMVDAGKFPPEGAPVIRLDPDARRAKVAAIAPRAGLAQSGGEQRHAA